MAQFGEGSGNPYISALLTGPSGSGKTLGALLLAHGICRYMQEQGIPNATAGIIDSERKRALYYRGHRLLGGFREVKGKKVATWHFAHETISAPYAPSTYISAIRKARKANLGVLIVDSLSHAWVGQGGMLERHDSLAQRTGNSWTAWNPINREDSALVEELMQYPGHVIVCCRADEQTVMVEADPSRRRKAEVKRMGLRALYRSGKRGSLIYEFPLAFMLEQGSCNADVQKDITGLFQDGTAQFAPRPLEEQDGFRLADWIYTSPQFEEQSEGFVDATQAAEAEAEAQQVLDEAALKEAESQAEVANQAGLVETPEVPAVVDDGSLDAPIEEIPAEDVPAEEIPAEDVPAEEVQVPQPKPLKRGGRSR